MYPASTPWVAVPGGRRGASMTQRAYWRVGAAAVPPDTIAFAHARYRSISLPAEYRSQPPTPGGRQPISENFSPLRPKNHSMWVADVSIPSAAMTQAAEWQSAA